MLYLKSCPKCGGDIQPGSDSYGSFLSCLQCGFHHDLATKQPSSDELAITVLAANLNVA